MRVRTGDVTRAVLSEIFDDVITAPELLECAARQVIPGILDELDRTTGVAIGQRMERAAGAGVAPLLHALTSYSIASSALDIGKIASFRKTLARRLEALLTELRCAYMGVSLEEINPPSSQALFDIPSMGAAPASRFLASRTRIVYEFVRLELGIPMAGSDNLRKAVYGMRARDRAGILDLEEAGLGKSVDTTYGDKVAMIVEAIRDGRIARIMAKMCQDV